MADVVVHSASVASQQRGKDGEKEDGQLVNGQTQAIKEIS